jgi:hypothetical protein
VTNPIHNSLSITICKDAADAIEQGFNYAAQGDAFKPIEIKRVVVVQKGTESGLPTVDLILEDATGQKFVCMLTGRLLKSIPC